jgi:DNA-binding transcriptional LysR family regulator
LRQAGIWGLNTRSKRKSAAARLRIFKSKLHNPRMFDWNDLKYFLAVARRGSTLAAAGALKISQSTVHRRLEELERRTGHKLVTRSPTGYKLTELGEDMVAYAAQVEEAVLAFERRLTASQKNLEGSVKITCPEAVGIRLMQSSLTKKLAERHPRLKLEFVISDKLLDLARGEADIAIRATQPMDGNLFGRKIADTAWGLYASRIYLDRHGKPGNVADLNEHAVILFDVELGQHLSNRWLRTVAPKARAGARCNSVTASIAAARSGVGLAALPMIVGDADGDLIRVLGPIPELTTQFYLLTHLDLLPSPRVRACFDFILENLSVVAPLLGAVK